MLNKKSIGLAKTIVSNESVMIAPRNGALLSESVWSSIPAVGLTQPSLEGFMDTVEQTADAAPSGVDIHDSNIATAVDTIGPALIRQMAYTRNIVVPLISKITDRLLDKMKGDEPKEFTIVQYDPSPLTYHPFTQELFSKFKVAGNAFKRIKSGPEKCESEIIEALKTGIPELDDALAEVISRDALAVKEAYEVLFCNKTPTVNTATSQLLKELITLDSNGLSTIKVNDVSKVDFAIVVYFIINAFGEDPLPGTGMSLTEYNTTINNMKNQLGFQILSSLNWVSRSLKEGRLILSYKGSRELVFTTEESEITVFGPVYRQAQSQGVTPESVIGGMFDQKGVQRSIAAQIQNKDANLKRWQLVERNRAQFARDTFFKRISANFTAVTEGALQELPADAFPVGFSVTEAVSVITQEIAKTNDFFKGWVYTDDVNLFDLVKRKVCKFIFTFIDAEEIIDVIETEMTQSDLLPEEVAYTAAVKYLAKWLVANFDVCPYATAEVQGLAGQEG